MKIRIKMSPTTSPSMDTRRPDELWTDIDLLLDDLQSPTERQQVMAPSSKIVATVPEDGPDLYTIQAPPPTLPLDFMEGDQINTTTPLPNNATTVTPLPNNATTVTPLPDNATTVTPLPDNATTVTPLQNNATTVTPLQNNETTVTSLPDNATTVIPLQNNATTVTPLPNNFPLVWNTVDQPLSEPMTTLEVAAGVQENLPTSPEQSPSPPASEPSSPLQQQQQQQQQPLVRVQSAPHLPQSHVSSAMGVSSDTLSFSSFPNMQKVMMYTLQPPSVQTNIPTLIMPQPSVQPGPSGVSGGNSCMGGMLDVPTLTDSKGEYGFTVLVEEKERTTKSPMWLMSLVTNKLYTNINKAVPFEVHLGNPPADRSQLQVRIVPVFSSPQFLRTNVTRCPNHSAPNDPTNHDFPYPEYVVRADHPLADYVQGANGRLAVVVPLDPLQDGPDYTPILLRFMCLGSCVGGINRRPIAIILTLENNQGECLGRKVIDVRVCACPTRDIKTDEQAAKGTKRKGVHTQETLPMYRKQPRLIEPKTDSEEDDQIFTIKVRGAALYKFLLGVKNMYYESHPDYAQQYPDISQHSVSSSLIHKKKATKKEVRNKQETVSELDNGLWESVTGSPTNSDHQVDEPPTDPLETNTNNTSPSNRIVQSQLKVLLVERNGINNLGESDVTTGGEFKHLQPQTHELHDLPLVITTTSSNESVTSGSVVSQPSTKVFPRHVPVMPVSTYQSTMRRVSSEPTRTKQTPRILRPPPSASPASHSPGRMVCIRTNPIKIERNLSPVMREGSVSPGSKEMLAANVLSERFYQDSSFT